MVPVLHRFTILVFVVTMCLSGQQTTTPDYYYGDYYYDDYDYGPPPNFYDLHGPDCATKHSCNSTSRYCYCDVSCDVFRDCCYDANVSERTRQIMNESHLTSAKLKVVFPYASCEYLPEVYRPWFIFVVNSCPLDSDETLKDLCNNETNTFLKPDLTCSWKSQYDGNYSIEELLTIDECKINYRGKDDIVFQNEVIRRCYPAIEECTNSTAKANDTIVNECKTGQNGYVFTESNIYINKGCFFCGEESGYNASCNMLDIYNTSWISESRSPSRYSYRMLFDLDTGNVKSQKRDGFVGMESKEFSIGGGCRDTQIFDPFAKSCRDVLCTEGFTFDRVGCLAANASLLQSGSCSVI